jgi:hypothetical protein
LTIELASFEADLVIAEGLAMYLTGDDRRQLFRRVAGLGADFVFDLVPSSEEPRPGITGRILGAAMKRFTGGSTFERGAKTREQVLGELRDDGFADAHAIDSSHAPCPLPHADRATAMVVFSASPRATRA